MQVAKLIPQEILNNCVAKNKSDYYYKSMTTHKQFIFMLYGVLSGCNSFNMLCKNAQFLDNKLTSINIKDLPARSTLADANTNRDCKVFEDLYNELVVHFSGYLNNEAFCFVSDIEGVKKIEIIDSSTITIFSEVFKGAGRNCLTGAKKGGLKLHTKLPLGGVTPNLVHITQAASSDKDFLGQLNFQTNTIYVFDKGYVNYSKWSEIDKKGSYWVTRLNKNAKYEILSPKINDIIDYADGGIISDSIILLKNKSTALEVRLIQYKDPESGKVLSFISNLLDYNPFTIAQLYKYRWSIEVFFKRLKQNFQLDYFFSDSTNGIKSQIWIVLIANLLMSVIHKMTKEKECFATTVSMAGRNMSDYTYLVGIICQERPTKKPKIRIVQFNLFPKNKGVVF